MKPDDYYKRNAKLGNVDGAWKNHVKKNKEAALLKNSKIFENNINKPKVSPKFRAETMLERIERISYKYGEATVKPKHLNNPNIISAENWKKKPEKWDGYHNLSNDQKQQSVAWNSHLETAKKPRSPEERREALDTKRMLMKTYNNPKLKNTLADDELKLIGKHKSQQSEATPVVIPRVPLRAPFKPSPAIDVNDFINEKSRLKPGISEDLIILNKEINKNIKYVLGSDDDNFQKVESNEREENENDKYKEAEID